MASDAIQGLDVKDKVAQAQRVASQTAGKAAEISSNVIGIASDAITDREGIQQAIGQATTVIKSTASSASQAARDAHGIVADAGGKAYQNAAAVRDFDYEQLGQANFYAEKFTQYSETFRATFEVDKSTMEMVDEVRGRLPVPMPKVRDMDPLLPPQFWCLNGDAA